MGQDVRQGRLGSDPQKQMSRLQFRSRNWCLREPARLTPKLFGLDLWRLLLLFGRPSRGGGARGTLKKVSLRSILELTPFCELLHLFLDAGEESIRAPPPSEHDCVDLLLGQIHHHRQGGSHRVSADFLARETQDIGSDCVDGALQVRHHLVGADPGEVHSVEESEDPQSSRKPG